MQRGARVTGRGWLAGLAAGGVVATHELTYRLAAHGHDEREALLDASGHRYWTPVLALALGVAAVALAGVAVRWSARRHAVPTWASTVWRLALLQALAWVGLEGLERLVVAHDVSGLLAEPVFWVGLGAQLLTAAVGALLLRVVAGAARRLGAGSPGPPARAATALPVLHTLVPRPPRLVLAGGGGMRSPPA